LRHGRKRLLLKLCVLSLLKNHRVDGHGKCHA
jgi:hypothetical protein